MLMLLNLNTDYDDTDADLCFRNMSLYMKYCERFVFISFLYPFILKYITYDKITSGLSAWVQCTDIVVDSGWANRHPL